MKVGILTDLRKMSAAKIEIIRATVAEIEKHFEVVSIAKAEAFLVIGGDGTMINVTKIHGHLGKPFYGVNRGTYGFYLNDHDNGDNFKKAMKQAEWIEFPLLEVEIHLENGRVKNVLAMNDVWTKSISINPGGSAKHRLFIDGQCLSYFDDNGREFPYSGDGIIICTPGGSTAYNFNVGGPVLGHKSDTFLLTPIAPGWPNRPFTPVQLSHDFEVVIEMVEINKRKNVLFADNLSFTKIKKAIIRRAKQAVRLGFKDGNQSYTQKVLKLKFPWLR